MTVGAFEEGGRGAIITAVAAAQCVVELVWSACWVELFWPLLSAVALVLQAATWLLGSCGTSWQASRRGATSAMPGSSRAPTW